MLCVSFCELDEYGTVIPRVMLKERAFHQSVCILYIKATSADMQIPAGYRWFSGDVSFCGQMCQHVEHHTKLAKLKLINRQRKTVWGRICERSPLWELIPVWAHAARGSVHWHTGTECSPPQPSVHSCRSAATPSFPSGQKGEERCQRGGGQNQRWQAHRAGRPGCRLKSLATYHMRYFRISSELRNLHSLHQMAISYSLCTGKY